MRGQQRKSGDRRRGGAHFADSLDLLEGVLSGGGGLPVDFDMLMLRADVGVDVADDAVTLWADQSGAGLDFAPDAGSQSLDTRDGIAVVRNNVSSAMESAPVVLTPEYSLWVHAYVVTPRNYGRILQLRPGNTAVSEHSTTGQTRFILNALNSLLTPSVIGAWHTWAVTVTGTAAVAVATMYLDGVAVGVPLTKAVFDSAKEVLFNSQADYAQIGIKQGTLSAVEIAALESYAVAQRSV